MSEYMKHTVFKAHRLPRVGYDEGGQLTEKVRRDPTTWCSLMKLKRLCGCLQHTPSDYGGWCLNRFGPQGGQKLGYHDLNVGAKNITRKEKSLGFSAGESPDSTAKEIKEKVMSELRKL